jgi:protein-L-isoaspartate(D-aspartate) O-methyltransferase
VWSVERHPALSEQAQRNLEAAKIYNVTLVVGDGGRGLPETAPFDAINVAAAAGDQIPQALEDQLGVGARLVVPVETGDQRLFVVHRTRRGLERKGLERVRFVPLVSS